MSSASSLYPIQLRQVIFTRACVIAIRGHEPAPDGKASIVPENSISVVQNPEHPRQFIATMRTVINKEAQPSGPYSIDMECAAEFETDGSLSNEEELRGVTINAHSVCYGAIREAVAWMTARQPYGPVALGMSILRSPIAHSPSPKNE